MVLYPLSGGGGEVDIFEILGGSPTVIRQTLHNGDGSSALSLSPSANINSGYHRVGVDWQSDFITFYVDGVQTGRVVPPTVGTTNYNQPFYINCGLAVGGSFSWAGTPANSLLVDPGVMLIDYIGVWPNFATAYPANPVTFTFSFTHPAVSAATAGMTVSVRNAADHTQVATSNTFAVISNNPNLPGAPTNLALISAANQSLTVGFAAPTSGGALDSGSYQLQYKVHTASTWTAGPVVPYCTNGVGSFTDANNTVWDVRSGQIRTTTGGLTTVDPVTSGVTYLTMINGIIWQFVPDTGKGWYSGSQPGGPWTGPVQIAPITSPGVQIGSPALATGTSYDVQVRAGNIAGFGLYCTPITASTLTPGAESFAITAIPQEYVSFTFTVSGGISNALSAPTMQYQDTVGGVAGAWTAFPGGSPITTSSFSFVHPAPSTTAATMTVGVRDANATNITAISNTFAVTTGTPPATKFTVSGGQILRPDGVTFKAQGFSILSPQLSPVASANCTPLATWLPGINIVGISTQSSNSSDGNALITQIDQVVTWLTAKHIVVFLGNYINTDFTGNTPIGTGTTPNRTTVNAWVTALGAKYKANPYVWLLAGPNEGLGSTAISQQHRAEYDAWRATGNNNPVMFNVIGAPSGSPSNPIQIDTSAGNYITMTNVIWSIHPYGWMPGNWGLNEGTAADDDSMLQQMVNAAQSIQQSADGVMPVIAAEFGNANGNNAPVNGATLFTRVIARMPVIATGYVGWIAPNWYGYRQDSGNNDNLIDPQTGQLSVGFGDYFNSHMNPAWAPPP